MAALKIQSQPLSEIPIGIHEDDFTDPRQIAESNIYTSTEKADFYQRYLDQERSSGFKKLFSESENWPQASRHALDEALAKTPKAIAYAARLTSTDDQIKFLDRMLALGYGDSGAAEAFVDIVSAATLNNIVSRLRDLSNLGKRVNAGDVGSGMYFLKRIAERSAELSSDAQETFAKSVVDFNIFEIPEIQANEVFRRQVLDIFWSNISGSEK